MMKTVSSGGKEKTNYPEKRRFFATSTQGTNCVQTQNDLPIQHPRYHMDQSLHFHNQTVGAYIQGRPSPPSRPWVKFVCNEKGGKGLCKKFWEGQLIKL